MATAINLQTRLSLFSIRERNIPSSNSSSIRSYSVIGTEHFSHGYRRWGCKKHRLVVKAGLSSENLDGLIRLSSEARSSLGDLLSRAEGIMYTVADAAVSSSDSVTDAAQKQQNGDWLSGITNYMEAVLKVLKNGFSALHVPYAYGFAIIFLTILVKAATFPLTKKQVESTMAVRTFQPQVKAIQQRYAGDQERIQLETARLYKLAGVNPLAGCLPTLATIPVWIGLYRALSNVADEGLLTEGFFWIPSLSGPTTIAARQSGSGISWLFPFVDGHPPLGWSDTLAYLVLPVLLVASQYISMQIMQPTQVDDPNQKTTQAITKFLPLMIGYFALSVPSGLSLYWFTNNILSTAQQIWLQKLGGAENPVRNFDDITIIQEKPPRSVSVADSQSKQAEAPSVSKGLRPGERFKQIKEQEARGRLQQEEEKRKAEEAAKRAEAINVGSTQEAELAKTSTNGLPTPDSLEEKTETSLEIGNGGLNHKKCMEEKDEDDSYKNLEKEQVE